MRPELPKPHRPREETLILLDQRVRDVNSVRVGVVGLGYVGLPLAVRLAERGFTVVGLDINAAVIAEIGEGNSTVEGLTNERIAHVLANKRLLLTTLPKDPEEIDIPSLNELSGLDAFIICVPTPLRAGHGWEPDLGYIRKAQRILWRICEAERDAEQRPKERLIVLESTTYPGTTREIFLPLLEAFGEKQWYLAYSPERTDPGRAATDPQRDSGQAEDPLSAYRIPRIVGGVDQKSLALACAFYETIYATVEPVSTLEAAEMTKLVENSFRFVSIAFANEMARVAKALHLNVWEVIGKALTKGFGLDLCYPGLIGGHCVPIDPHYLASVMRTHREPTGFIDLAEKIHQDTRRDAIDLIHRLLNRRGRSVSGSRIVFFGVAYKADIGDIRESAALQIMKSLYSAGANVSYWDPVRAGHSVKSRPQLVFTKQEHATLLPGARETLKEKGDLYVYEPAELGRTWAEVRKQVLNDDVNCIVLAAAHTDFRLTYADILSTEKRPAVADLCNAIAPWLRKLPETPAGPGAADRYRQSLAAYGDYALLGVEQIELPQYGTGRGT